MAVAVMILILFFIEHTILYKGNGFLLFKQGVVFLRAVPGVGNKYFGRFAKAGFVLGQMSAQGIGVGGVRMNGIVDDKLVGCRYLNILAWF